MVAFDREQEVREILDKVRPALLADAGNIELVKVENDEVFLKLYGTCQTCPVADMTMKDLVIYTIKESLPWVKAVNIGEEKYKIT